MDIVKKPYWEDDFLHVLLYHSKMSECGFYMEIEGHEWDRILEMVGWSEMRDGMNPETAFVNRADYAKHWKEYKQKYIL